MHTLTDPAPLTGSMFPILEPTYRNQARNNQLHDAFSRDQYVLFRGLLSPELLALISSELERLQVFAKRRDFYMRGPETPRAMATLGGQALRRHSALLSNVYGSPELRTLISQIVGRTVYDCKDPNEWMISTTLKGPGDTHGWHLDDPPLALVLIVESPVAESGGLVEYIPAWRCVSADLGFDPSGPVDAAIAGCRSGGFIHTQEHMAGDAYLLFASEALHRVTPLTGEGARRRILNMAFELEPNTRRIGVSAQTLFDS